MDRAGYRKYFIYGTGNFVGLDVHNAGIYIPEEGIGIRIEDIVLVTDEGPVVLSRYIPRTVQEIEDTMKGSEQ